MQEWVYFVCDKLAVIFTHILTLDCYVTQSQQPPVDMLMRCDTLGGHVGAGTREHMRVGVLQSHGSMRPRHGCRCVYACTTLHVSNNDLSSGLYGPISSTTTTTQMAPYVCSYFSIIVYFEDLSSPIHLKILYATERIMPCKSQAWMDWGGVICGGRIDCDRCSRVTRATAYLAPGAAIRVDQSELPVGCADTRGCGYGTAPQGSVVFKLQEIMARGEQGYIEVYMKIWVV